MKRSLLLPVLCTFVLSACGQSNTNERAVRVMAEVQPTQPFINLQWQEHADATGYSVFRRAPGGTTWGAAIASLPGSALGYQDAAVLQGVPYE